jgi:uncharacterized membrane protein
MEEQIVEILQAVKEVTPEVAAQAVAYGRWCNVCWLVFALIGGLLAALVARLCYKNWDWNAYVPPAIISGIVLAICSLIGVCSTGDLIGSYIAPDYFAVEAVIDMFKVTR